MAYEQMFGPFQVELSLPIMKTPWTLGTNNLIRVLG